MLRFAPRYPLQVFKTRKEPLPHVNLVPAARVCGARLDLRALQGRRDRRGLRRCGRDRRRRRPRHQARASPRHGRGRRGRRGRDRRGRIRGGGGMSASTKHLIRHYVEMVIAMFVGMGVLAIPAGVVLGAMGIDGDDPAVMLLSMATTMTVSMVGWMVYRGHGRRANAEMSASMFVPTFAVIGLLSADLLTDIGALMVIEHVAMLLAM